MATKKYVSFPATGEARIVVSAHAVYCSGAWTVHEARHLERQLAAVAWPDIGEAIVDGSALTEMDTAGAWLLHRVIRSLEQAGRTVSVRGLRPEFQSLLQIIQAPAMETALRALPAIRPGMLEHVGRLAWGVGNHILAMLSFIGACALMLARSLSRPGRIRWRPVLHNLQSSGFHALPIVGLLSFLMGVVIGYQGAGQLSRYGANIFIADLVGLSMLRELSPLLTAIIVAGRSGSAYAAQIGTMKVTEEVDALRTIGVAPIEQLVLPKVLALLVALPLLTVYADILGVFGGMVMAKAQLHVGYAEFLDRLGDAVSLSSYLIGVGKAPVFAAIIAIVGCFRGFQVTGSADSVGRETTVSVVQAIFLVIIADALFSIVFSKLDL
ncbi:MAG: MlaE family lipid ABC transporter permease subunit [Gammaproteobacteria bacterium]|nr:MlaE family lipid ABC transporter permease subunit [Gammaproteobacteria bacterium]